MVYGHNFMVHLVVKVWQGLAGVVVCGTVLQVDLGSGMNSPFGGNIAT